MRQTALKRKTQLTRKTRIGPSRTPAAARKRRLDRLASQWCISKGYCEAADFFGTPCFGRLTPHHVSKRKHLRNRWNPRNLKCVCEGHHNAIEASRRKERVWLDATWPGLWEELKELEIGKACLNLERLEELWKLRAA